MATRRELTIPCRACNKDTRVRGPLAVDLMQIRCERCGYEFVLSVGYLKQTHGAHEYADGTWWVIH